MVLVKETPPDAAFFSFVNYSAHLLLVVIDFCLVLSNAAESYFQGFCGIYVLSGSVLIHQ